jgi:NACalpha-BTF3-like transcription factor
VAANPKKGAVLGIMFLVALYFWAPLVMGWIGTKEQGSPPTPAVPMSDFAASSTPGPQATAQTSPETSWYLLAEWMDRDPLKQAARPRAGQRDPFQNRVEIVRQKQETQVPAVKKPVVTAETLALSLMGTMVGEGRRIAVLNGKSYRENDEVKVSNKDQTLVVRLAEVRADRVVVACDGQQIEIKQRTRPTTSHIELMGKNE